MSFDPDEIARRIQAHRPGWSVWFGRATGLYWAVACWAWMPRGMLGAATPDAIDAAITTFEALVPKPQQRRAHVVDP